MSRSLHHCSKRVENSLLRYTGEALHAAGVHLSPRSVSIGRCNIKGPNKNVLLSRDRLIHACWDFAHHLCGNSIWPFMPSSAFGCMILYSMIAPWFLAGAPSFLKRPHVAVRTAGA